MPSAGTVKGGTDVLTGCCGPHAGTGQAASATGRPRARLADRVALPVVQAAAAHQGVALLAHDRKQEPKHSVDTGFWQRG